MTRSPGARAAFRVVAARALASLTTALIMSCNRDQVTTPTAGGIHPPTQGSHDVTGESPLTASASVAATGIDAMPGDSAELGYYPMPTIVELQIAQSITINPLRPGDPAGGLPLGGRLTGDGACVGGEALVWVPRPGGLPATFNGCSLWALGAGGNTNWTDTIQVDQHTFVGHAGDAVGSCQNCYSYSGSTSATLRRLDFNFAIGAAPFSGGLFLDSVSVNPGDSVIFEMLAQPHQISVRGQIYGVLTASDSSQWRFVADDGEVLTGCPLSDFFRFGQCGRVMAKSGTMHLNGYVNGALKTEVSAVHVTVKPASPLVVTCSPSTAVRVSSVTCTASRADGSQFTPKHLRSTTMDARVIVDGDVANQATTRLDWRGPAIVSTQVAVTATVGTKDTTAIGSFSVNPRIGQIAGWMDEDFPDNGFSATPPMPTLSKTAPPFSVKYPGFTFSPDTLAGEGALGVTIYDYPNLPLFATPNAGPNAGISFANSVPWSADSRYAGFGVGIYLEQSTDSADPFYKKQKGPAPYCTQSNMAQIASVLLAHEQRHWNTAHTAVSGVNLMRTLDSAKVIPGESTDGLSTTWTRVSQAYADSITASNTETHSVPDNYPSCQVRK
jgi:hypothetical protein